MPSTKKILLITLLLLLCCLCVIIDARMPDCEGMQDKCQCHPSYTSYRDNTKKHQKNCLKIFSEKKSWDIASQTCASEFSTLLHYREAYSFFEEFRQRDVDLIWIGIRKKLGFYIAEASVEYVFKESKKAPLGLMWRDGEPIYDCVALHISSGYLVTQNCSTELEYVCKNYGLPVYPVSKSLACQKDWQFFYHLPEWRLPCIKVFKSLPGQNATATCLELGGQVADIGDFYDLYNHMSKLNIPGYGLKNTLPVCQKEYIESVLGDYLKENVTCEDRVFICERHTRRISLKPQILKDFSGSVESANIQQSFLTCEVPFKGRDSSEIADQLHYVWYKDEIPISVDSPILNLSSYPEPVKNLSSPAIRQGTYSCVVTVEGIADFFSSQYVDYFHSDVATYILYMQADLKSMQYVDFSSGYFPTFKELLDNFMEQYSLLPASVGLPPYVPKVEWDYQMSWKNEENFTVQFLLYFRRKLDDKILIRNENQFYHTVKRKFKEHLSVVINNANVSLELDNADTCFEQTLSTQTKSAISEPMCLNDWRLVTRKCTPSVIWGATWGHFNSSECTKYQLPVQELKIKCPDGFKTLDFNLCYAIHNEQKTFEEAEEICQSRSSVLADFKLLNKGILFLRLVSPAGPLPNTEQVLWLSNRRDLKDEAKEEWFENNSTLKKRNPVLLCASKENKRAFFNGKLLPKNCDSSERHPFVCIHQPYLLLNSFILSKPWYKYSHKRTSYYVEHSGKKWQEANKSCHDFPAKSTLLQGVRNLEEYSIFKVFLRQLDHSGMSSFWMNLFQDGDSLKWLTSPEESPTFVDWERHADFYMDRSAGVLTKGSESGALWSLRDLSSKQGSICETHDLQDSDHTVVYVEDRTSGQEDESGGAYEVDLQCVPRGWYVSNSIIWFKDGDAMYTETSDQRLHLSLKSPFRMQNISHLQGYYYCSVALENPSKYTFSPKVLVKFPGVHTFVLHMKSKIPKYSRCSDINSLELPFIEEFNKYLDAHYSNDSRLFLKAVTCTDSLISTYHHFYILKDEGTEKELQNFLERSIISGNGTLFEALQRLNINKDDISFKSTVSCPKEISYHHGHHLTWPETPIGQSTFPDEMCITEEGSALERKCLGDFYMGAHWRPVEKDCAEVQSELTMTLHKLAKVDVTEDNILNSSLSLEMLTTISEHLSPTDVQYVAQILRNVASIPAVESEVLRSVVHTVDTTMDQISTSEERDILSNVTSKISSAVGNITLNAQTNEKAVEVAGNNIAVSVLPLTLVPRGAVLEKWDSNLTVLLNDSDKDADERLDRFESFEAAVFLPENVLAENHRNNRTNMAFVIRRNSQLFRNVEVISPVIDVFMGAEHVYDVDPPLYMVFKVKELNLREKKSNWGCASWDETLNPNFGGWSYKGCFTVLIDPTHVRCYCDHLKSFAVISEINTEFEIPKSHKGVANNTTYIVFSLLLFGLGISILIYVIFRRRRRQEVLVQDIHPLPVIDTKFTSHVASTPN